MVRDRAWLRGFLNLAARAVPDGVPQADIERQEDTVLRALTLLDKRPGVVLADEVGMGKTFEALGVLAAVLHQNPQGRALVLTPGPDLNKKWHKEFRRFEEERRTIHDFGQRYKAATRMDEFLRVCSESPIVIAPVTIFTSGKAGDSQAHLLSLFCRWMGFPGATTQAIFRRVRDGKFTPVDVESTRFLGHADFAMVAPYLDRAFAADDDEVTLGGIYDQLDLEGFTRKDLVAQALETARFRLVRELLPVFDLVIVDEAHKLKNEETVRTRGMSTTLRQRLRKALFLTATPFQLAVGELRQIFRLFSLATTAPANLMEQVAGLFDSIDAYQVAYQAFEHVWFRTDPEIAEQFRALYARCPALDEPIHDPSVREIADRARELQRLKSEQIEPGFRSWMIRSLREDKRQYRRHQRERRVPEPAAQLPFLVYERFLAELFRQQQQTHKAAVEINMVSSYGAARDGALIASTDPERFTGDMEAYRGLLRDMLGDLRADGTAHPKMQFVQHDAITAARHGEKTLIFCARVATLSDLAKSIDQEWQELVLERWREVFPDAAFDDIFDRDEDGKRERGRHGQLQRRFHNTHDALYLGLRERHVQSLLMLGDWPLGRLDAIVADANERLRTVRTGKSSAARLDYRLAQRCLEQATAVLWSRENPDEVPLYSEALGQLTDPAFLRLGLDLEDDDLEKDQKGDEQPEWTISRDVAERVLGPQLSLWAYLKGGLEGLSFVTRVRVVERLARYLTYRQMTFLPELLAESRPHGVDFHAIESPRLLASVDRFWETESGRHWVKLLDQFLRYLGDRDQAEQTEILDGPIATGDFVRQTRDGESRERLREAFNTPLFPMVLVVNEVMQEGLDLHRHCRRIIHHDLAWNPAQLEQRVGRIDRIGSRTLQLRRKDPGVTLDVLYPLVHRTIDERLYRTVKMREKWLEFLLGAAPSYDEYALGDVTPPPLPDGFAESLRIDLRPACLLTASLGCGRTGSSVTHRCCR